MSKPHIPLTVKARVIVDQAGGIKNVTPEMLIEGLKIDRKVAWSLMWRFRNHPNCGKAANGPYSKVANGHNGKSHTFIRPHSAAARLLRAVDNELSPDEKAFMAVVQLIGVQRAEELLQELRDQLTRAVKGMS